MRGDMHPQDTRGNMRPPETRGNMHSRDLPVNMYPNDRHGNSIMHPSDKPSMSDDDYPKDSYNNRLPTSPSYNYDARFPPNDPLPSRPLPVQGTAHGPRGPSGLSDPPLAPPMSMGVGSPDKARQGRIPMLSSGVGLGERGAEDSGLEDDKMPLGGVKTLPKKVLGKGMDMGDVGGRSGLLQGGYGGDREGVDVFKGERVGPGRLSELDKGRRADDLYREGVSVGGGGGGYGGYGTDGGNILMTSV